VEHIQELRVVVGTRLLFCMRSVVIALDEANRVGLRAVIEFDAAGLD
jgi:hypothetical protein